MLCSGRLKSSPRFSRLIEASHLSVAAGCWSLCVEKSRVILPGSVGSGRKRRPQIEQAYSPVHMCLPSWFVITALRRTFSAGIVKAYIDSSNTIGKNVSKCTLTDSLILTYLRALNAVTICGKLKTMQTVLACNLNAISQQNLHRYKDLFRRIQAAITDRRELEDGYVFRLDGDSVSLPDVAQWISLERLC